MCIDLNEKLLREIELILSKTTLINMCIVYYKQLIDAKTNQSDKYSIGKNFFNSVSSAYEYVIACELTKIYNKKEEKESLYSIISSCKDNESVFENEGEYNKYLSNARKEIKKLDINIIKTYRHKYFAHSDEIYFGKEEDLLKEYPFDLDKFDKLNNYAIDILSDIYGKIENCYYRYNPNLLTGFDLNNIIKNLK